MFPGHGHDDGHCDAERDHEREVAPRLGLAALAHLRGDHGVAPVASMVAKPTTRLTTGQAMLMEAMASLETNRATNMTSTTV